MAGLFDWLTDGLGSLGSADIGGQPPASPMATPPAPQAPQPPMQVQPPFDPSTTDLGGGMQGAGQQAAPVPLPTARPAAADLPTMETPPSPPDSGALPPNAAPTSSAIPPGPPTSLAPGGGLNGVGPGLGVGGPPDGFSAPAAGPSWMPDQQGRGGILSRALGMTPDQSNRLAAGLGAGFTAAGNSAGKSPFQALAGGAGATLEGGEKERHQNAKEAQGYLAQSIAAQKAGDDAAAKLFYNKYLLLDLQQSAANKDASKTAANKNDSPTQLFLAAQRNVAGDPLVKGAMEAYKSALKGGTPDDVAKAKAAYEQTFTERQQAHLAGVGLHPQDAAEIAKQPGMSQANPLDAGAAGITPENIGQKLQPGQYYKNPTDGQVYQFKGAATNKATKDVTPAVSKKPKPRDPMNPGRGSLPASAPADAEAE